MRQTEGSIDLGEAAEDGDMIFSTGYSNPRSLVSWVLGLGPNARLLGPPELVEELSRRMDMLLERHEEDPPASRRRRGPIVPEATSGKRSGRKGSADAEGEGAGRPDTAIRPERFARLVTLASILIAAGRLGERVVMAEVCERLQISDEELREDVNVLNVVNFGGGSYVLYAEIKEEEGEIEVDPEPYSDNFDRPARLLPVEAKALIAAIDLIGEHIPEGSLASARTKIVAALGEDPMEQGLQVAPPSGDDSDVARVISKAIVGRRLIELEYFKENEDEISLRKVEPYALTNGREGWYVACFDPDRDGVRHFRLDRIKSAHVSDEKFQPRPEVDPAAEVDGWLRTGEVEASRSARVWVSAGACALGAGGQAGGRGAHRRLGAGRSELRRRRLAGSRDPQGSRRRGRARAAGCSRGGQSRRRPPARGRRLTRWHPA